MPKFTQELLSGKIVKSIPSNDRILLRSLYAISALKFLKEDDYFRAAALFDPYYKSLSMSLIDIFSAPDVLLAKGLERKYIDKYLGEYQFYNKSKLRYVVSMKYARKRQYDKAIEVMNDKPGLMRKISQFIKNKVHTESIEYRPDFFKKQTVVSKAKSMPSFSSS